MNLVSLSGAGRRARGSDTIAMPSAISFGDDDPANVRKQS